MLAAEHLCELGAGVLILGCTELPLVLDHCEGVDINGHTVALVDPTTILALKCIALAEKTAKPMAPPKAPSSVATLSI